MTTILITGANRGIGLELTKQYLADGARVIACCRNPGSADELNTLTGDISIHAVDVGSDECVAALKAELGDQAIDVLLNNAGITGGNAQVLGNIDTEAWLDCLNVNTVGPFRMIDAFKDNVGASDEKKIVTISSFMGSIGRMGQASYIYRSSKAAVNMVTTLAATELRDQGIIAVPMHPGWVRTDMGGSSADLSTEESASGIREVIRGLTIEKSARFWNYNGEELPW